MLLYAPVLFFAHQYRRNRKSTVHDYIHSNNTRAGGEVIYGCGKKCRYGLIVLTVYSMAYIPNNRLLTGATALWLATKTSAHKNKQIVKVFTIKN